MSLATFTHTPLVGGGILVEGTDGSGKEGTAVLRSDAYVQLKSLQLQAEADAELGDEVRTFFKPLLDAAENYRVKTEAPSRATTVTVKEGVEPTAGEQPVEVELDDQGFVLYTLIDLGDVDSLRWVGGDLVVVA